MGLEKTGGAPFEELMGVSYHLCNEQGTQWGCFPSWVNSKQVRRRVRGWEAGQGTRQEKVRGDDDRVMVDERALDLEESGGL